MQQLSNLPELWLSPALLLLVIVAGFWWRVRLWRWMAGIAAGFLWSWLYGYLMLMDRLPSDWEGRDLLLEGWISSIPKNLERVTSFDLNTSTLTINGEPRPWPRTVRLFWYETPPPLIVGERWQLSARLKRPYSLMNPGGFDQEGFWLRHGIHAIGTVRHQPPAVRLDSSDWHYFVDRLRQNLAADLTQALPESSYRGLIQGLALGITTAITPAQWDILQQTGTIHLLSISGSHIALVAGLAYWITRHLWAWAGRAPLWLAAPRAGAVAAMVTALGYAAVAGFPLPTQRAVVMVSITMIAVLINRIGNPIRILGNTLFIILLWNPLMVTDAGFWLSFGAVAIILYGITGRRRMSSGYRAHWRAFLRVQWWLTIGLTPFMLAIFHYFATYAPLANLIAVPWLELGTVPAVLVGTMLLPMMPSIGNQLLAWVDFSLRGLWPILEYIAALPQPIWSPPAPPAPWVTIVAVAGAALLLAPHGVPGRWLGMIGMAPLFLFTLPRPPSGELWLTVLDVGHGLSTVVRTTNHTLVYDTGPRHGWFDAGAVVVTPFLRYIGTRQIDTLLVSHPDNDHSGGTASVLAALDTPPRLIGAILDGEPCQHGITWHWDGFNFRVIHPTTPNQFSGNDASCVLRIEWQGGALLLTGDIGRTAEEQILDHPEDLPATVLVVPHHGSRHSSTATFVATVMPQVVIYSTGYRNRFGFPHPAVAARYTAIGAQTFDTAQHGAITLRLGPGLLPRVSAWRAEARRYWHSEKIPLGN